MTGLRDIAGASGIMSIAFVPNTEVAIGVPIIANRDSNDDATEIRRRDGRNAELWLGLNLYYHWHAIVMIQACYHFYWM